MIILRQKKFSAEETVEQREFNSKAAKALNNKFLRQYAIDNEISRELLVCKKPLNPQTIKRAARLRNQYGEEGHLLVNKHINDKSKWASGASDMGLRGSLRKIKDKEYDHGRPLSEIASGHPSNIVANNPWSGEVEEVKRELRDLRAAAKKKKK